MFTADPPLARTTMNQNAGDARPDFTPKQGQYLAFIYAYTLVNARPPAQADMQRFFQVAPPTVHQMLLTLEKTGLISRHPGAARSIAVQVDRADPPTLNPEYAQTVKTSVQRYYACTIQHQVDRASTSRNARLPPCERPTAPARRAVVRGGR